MDLIVNALLLIFLLLMDYIFASCKKAVDEQSQRND